MDLPAPRSFYIGGEGHTVLAAFHPAAGTMEKPPVLFVPPWGWDELASFRVRRDWAGRLAAAGHPTLRFALPATGNSGGSPRDPHLVEAWIASVGSTAGWLSNETGGGEVAIVGFGLGGLLAIAAATAGAPIGDLTLWGTPKSGAAFAREARAFSRLDKLPPSDPPLPAGWLEAGGFLLSAETVDDLGALPIVPDGFPPRRALLLGRDGVGPPSELEGLLGGAGVETTTDPGVGWDQLCAHPETATLPVQVADRLEAWLAEGQGPAAMREPAPKPMSTATDLVIDVDGRRVRERPISFRQDWGNAFGVLAAPAGGMGSGTVAVFLNAGAIYSCGPSRMWADAARACAARGVAALRLDLEGIGEADGEAGGVLRGEKFNMPRFELQLRAVIEELSGKEGASGFVLVGLCAGGHTAFRTATDATVLEAMLINGSALRWDDSLPMAREARKVSRALDRRWLGNLVRGEVRVERLLALASSLVLQLVRGVRGIVSRRRGEVEVSLEAPIEADLDLLAASGTHLLLAFSADEALDAELRATGLAKKIAAVPGFEFRSLPGADHTLRPISTQARLRELVVAEALARAGLATHAARVGVGATEAASEADRP